MKRQPEPGTVRQVADQTGKRGGGRCDGPGGGGSKDHRRECERPKDPPQEAIRHAPADGRRLVERLATEEDPIGDTDDLRDEEVNDKTDELRVGSDEVGDFRQIADLDHDESEQQPADQAGCSAPADGTRTP